MRRGNCRGNDVYGFLLFTVCLVMAAIVFRMAGLDEYLDGDRLQSWVRSFGPWGPVVYILFYSIAPTLLIPSLPVTAAAGLVFGPVYGTIYASIGAIIGASLAFLIARYLARSKIERLVRGRLKSIDEEVERKGWIFVAVARLIPLFPFNFLNYALGLTRIRFSHYVIVSFISMLPWTAAYVIFSSSLLDLLTGSLSSEFIAGVILLAALSIAHFIYRKRERSLRKP